MTIYTSTKAMAYVYMCIHKNTGEFYIGYRCANVHLNRFSHIDFPLYRTSNPEIKHNFLNFDWIIVAEFFDSDSAYDYEQQLIHEYWNDLLLINKSCYYDKPRFKSKPLTDEHKRSIGLAQSKPKTQEHKNKIAIANIGKHWYNNGILQLQARSCPINWVAGRLNGGSGFGKKNNNYGKTGINSPLYGKKHSIIKCPHCQKEGGSHIMKRHHFDNCSKTL